MHDCNTPTIFSPGKCPCCARPLPPTIVVTGTKRREVFDYIRRCGGRGVTRTQIFEYLYGADPNGGPDSGSIISVIIWHLNRQIKPQGWIVRGTGGQGSVYQLKRVEK